MKDIKNICISTQLTLVVFFLVVNIVVGRLTCLSSGSHCKTVHWAVYCLSDTDGINTLGPDQGADTGKGILSYGMKTCSTNWFTGSIFC